MRKKNLWQKIVMLTMCSMLIFSAPAIHAADVEQLVQDEQATDGEQQTAPTASTVTCEQTVFNGRDNIVLHFNSDKKFTNLVLWIPAIGSETEFAPFKDLNNTKYDLQDGTVVIDAKTLYENIKSVVYASSIEGQKIGLGLEFDGKEDVLGGILTINTKDEGQTNPDGNGGETTPDGNGNGGETTPDGNGNTDTQKPEVKPEESQKPEVEPEESPKPEVKPEESQKPEVKPAGQTQQQQAVTNTTTESRNPKTGDVTGFAGVLGTGLSSLGVATITLLRKYRKNK